MSKKDRITLTRTGKIEFVVVGDHHCGVAPAGEKQHADYEVRLRCAPVLDKRHFLVEQLNIASYMDGIKVVEQSCEKLVMDTAYDLLEMCGMENKRLRIKWIEVTIKAAPYAAFMTFRLHP